MHKKCFSMLLLAKAIVVFASIPAEEQLGNNLFTSPTVDNGASKRNLQESLQAYYQTMQSLPFHRANTNFANHAGYNYIQPASTSTFAGYSTTTHNTETTPLSLSLHSQDNQKTAETYFQPNQASSTTTKKSQPYFYVPRTTDNRMHVQTQNTETKFDGEAFGSAQSIQTTNDALKYPFDLNYKMLRQKVQQNWRPLPAQQHFEKTLNIFSEEAPSNANQIPQGASTNAVFDQFNQELIMKFKNNLTSFRHEPLFDCEKNSPKLKNTETNLRSPIPLQSQVIPVPLQKTSPAVTSTSFVRSIESLRNSPASSSVNALNYLRLNIIKSLLAEYLALTQSTIESPQHRAKTGFNFNDIAGNIGDNKIPAEPEDIQFPAYSQNGMPSSAANKFSDTFHLRRQQTYQARPMIPVNWQPHSVYGSPFVNSINPVEE